MEKKVKANLKETIRKIRAGETTPRKYPGEEPPTKEEARYASDAQTLDNQVGDKPCTSKDLGILRVLPENYKIWKEKYDRKKVIDEVSDKVNDWVSHWNNGRVQCLTEIKETVEKYPIYTVGDLKQFIVDKIKLKKEAEAPTVVAAEVKVDHTPGEDIKSQYLELVRDKKWGDASELLVNYILERFYIYTTKDDLKSEVWVYEEGVYRPEGKSNIKAVLRELLGSWYSTFTYNNVIAKIEPDTFIDSETFFNTNYREEVPVKNGILNVLSGELKPFDSNKIFFNKLPVEYKPDATCEKIDEFLSQVLANEEDKKVFYELGGFALFKEYTFEKSFMLVGDGRNGKGKALELYKRVIGHENCYSLPLIALSHNNADVHQLFGKMLNLAGDIGSGDLKDTSMFKGLTGRDPITSKRKFLNAITFVNYAKFVFACNELPIVYDMSKGFWDRWVLLEFPYYFATQEEIDKTSKDKQMNWKLRDEEIIDKITTPEELSGLLNKFLQGLKDLFKNRRFSSTKGSEEVKTTWIRKSNSILAFCNDCLEVAYETYILKKDFRRKYQEYCSKHKLKMETDFVIKKVLVESLGAWEDKTQALGMYERTWAGVKWK